MNKKSLVSIIITCYNYAEYVGEAIESVLGQTYKNIELIVIDDGSTDESVEKMNKYRKSIRVVSRENRGVIYTRNEGVRLSNGKFTMQLDADDTLEPTYVDECVKAAEKDDLDIVYTQAHLFGRADFVTQHIDFDLEKLKHDNYMHAASLVRKSKMGADPYDEYLDRLGYEDWDVFLDMCLDGAKAGLVDKPLLNYRKHTDRKSRADNFEGLYKESLVRHHIWSKQNEKHRDEFWYFSSQINSLLETIELYQDSAKLKQDVDRLSKRVHKLESRDIVTQLKKVKRKITRS